MPTETPTRSTETPSWNIQDLTSECDADLDTITTDKQVEIRRIAIALVEDHAVPASSRY
jgi:hypothetical protein